MRSQALELFRRRAVRHHHQLGPRGAGARPPQGIEAGECEPGLVEDQNADRNMRIVRDAGPPAHEGFGPRGTHVSMSSVMPCAPPGYASLWLYTATPDRFSPCLANKNASSRRRRR